MEALTPVTEIRTAHGRPPAPSISFVIPTFNEAPNLPRLFETLLHFARDSGVSVEVVVVDDSSPDGTGELAEGLAIRFDDIVRARVVHRASKLGLGGALHEGLLASSGRYVVMLDADNSHDLSCLPEMMRAAESGAEVVIGSRYARGGRIEHWPIYRWVISLGATCLSRVLFDLNVRDPVSGFAVLSRDLVSRFPGPSNPRSSKLLLDILATMEPAPVVEVPIHFRNRASGKSKFTASDLLEFVRLVLALTRERGRTAHAPVPTHHA